MATITLKPHGILTWQTRRLEAILVNVTVKLKNRRLGAYDNKCFTLAQAIDSEFNMYRTPLTTKCTSGSLVERWKTGKQFKSLWIAK